MKKLETVHTMSHVLKSQAPINQALKIRTWYFHTNPEVPCPGSLQNAYIAALFGKFGTQLNKNGNLTSSPNLPIFCLKYSRFFSTFLFTVYDLSKLGSGVEVGLRGLGRETGCEPPSL